MVKRIIYSIVFIIGISSCQSEYQKMLKSNDYEQMYTKGMVYYDSGEYFKAYSLFEKLIPVYRVTERGEKISYYIARCYYEETDYLMSAYYFNRFIISFPNSDLKETAQYYMSLCYYYNSPKPSLDQTYTKKAIDAFQLYINKYPQGMYVKESNTYIAELRKKLEQKAYSTAKLYYTLEDYKAAVVALKNCLLEYADSEFREEIMYMTFRSAFLLAEKSVEAKKQDRYEAAIEEYRNYIDEFPQGSWIKESERMFSSIQKKI